LARYQNRRSSPGGFLLGSRELEKGTPLMTTTSENSDKIIVSYVRRPDEHIAVMQQAGRRFTLRRPVNAFDRAGLLLLCAIGSGGGAAVLHVLRTYFYVPILGYRRPSTRVI
jgi:hypothetical protein